MGQFSAESIWDGDRAVYICPNMVFRKIMYTQSGPTGETTVTRWVDTDAEWWLTPLVETRIRIEGDGVHGSKREVHEITVTHDSGTSVSVETKPLREWDRLPSTTYNTLSRALEWRK